ncbi:JmjC domain-containing protein [Kitasatospora sp. SUK 42]|uniref:JmjC domain-containing protein n=1 Tax=Kitasatospora sp. SUK 42 TaxID=1588882 RepID=UPI0018CB29E9|nr:cupin domain-containing protein [Kitasatospora sp. SUK 42]MBV2153685.1 cupin domain-containing protein [Kitasatospora sp. SUK 42]
MSEPTQSPRGVLYRLTGRPEDFDGPGPAEPVLYRGRGDLRDLISYAAVDRMLGERPLRRPALRLIHRGRQLQDHEYVHQRTVHADMADPLRIGSWLAEGATLVLQGLEDFWNPVGELAAGLGRELGHPVHVNAYLTPRGNAGFGLHYDTHSAFILQVEGEKEWVFHRPRVADPLAHETWENTVARNGWETLVPPGSPEYLRTVLRAGDCLWLPRGWIHAAEATEHPSLHLTVSVSTATAAWAWLELAGRIATSPGMRAVLGGAVVTDGEQARIAVRAVLDEAARWIDSADVAELGELVRTAALGRFPGPLPEAATGYVGATPQDYLTRRFRVLSHHVFGVEVAGETLRLRLARRTLTMPAKLREGVESVLAHSEVTSEQLSWLGDPASRIALLQHLHREGLLAMLPDQSDRPFPPVTN